jgi:anti-sigma B factor antagonist
MRANPLTRAIMRACSEREYRARLLADPTRALAQEGLQVPDGVTVVVHEASDDRLIVVLPDPEMERQLARQADLPDGVVCDVPGSLRLEWRGFTLVASGRIDAQGAPVLRREIERASTDLDLDLANVGFIGSAGLAALLAAHKRLLEHNSEVRLVRVPEPILNVLELAGFGDLFEITRDESLAYLAAACRL